jgi:hypothetical protein
VIPTLKAIGLFSARIAHHFDDMFQMNVGPNAVGTLDDPHGLPEDLEAWVESTGA